MLKPPVTSSEAERVKVVQEYTLLTTLPEKDYDDISMLASCICKVPISAITLIDENDQWFISKQGLSNNSLSKDLSFCAHAINYPREIFVVNDARKDERFNDNPLVTGEPNVVFYAGVPLVTKDGFALGTICVVDIKPRTLNKYQVKSLEALSRQVMRLFELRRNNINLDLKQSELSKLLNVFEQTGKVANVGGWEVDLVNNTVTWTSATRRIHEVPDTYVPQLQSEIDFYAPGESRDKIIKVINNAIEKEISFDEELKIITGKGNIRWVRVKGKPEFKDGKCVRIIGVFQDIHTQKIKSIQLAQSEELFRKTLDNAPIGIALVSPDGKWIKVNKSVCDIVGYSAQEILEISFQDFTHPDDLSKDLKYIDSLLKGKIQSYQLEKRYIHKNGKIIWILLSVSLVKDLFGNPLYFVAHIMNITDRKNNEQLLKDEKTLLFTLINNLPVNIFIKDLQSRKTLVNKQEINYLGYRSERDILGKTDYELYPKNSADISVEEDQQVFTSGIPIIDKETCNIKHDGSENWFYTSKIPLRNESDAVVGLLGISYNINERKKYEKKQNELVNIMSDQNVRLQNFAYIVSHNLKTHCANFTLLADFLAAEKNETERIELACLLKQAADNLSITINDLNDVVDAGSFAVKEMQPVNLFATIEKVYNNVKALILNNLVEFVNEVPKNIYIKAIPAYIESVFHNFITNSVKYRAKEKQSFVSIKAIVENSFVTLCIQDNGLGIDLKKHGDKLFGMYKTFHGNKDAKGIGLFITKNQIETMNGKVEVESEPNAGTTFKVIFPIIN